MNIRSSSFYIIYIHICLNRMNYTNEVSGHNTFINLGASNHSENERSKNDFYATPPLAVEHLLEVEDFNKKIWEPACGMNHITNILRTNGYDVRISDIIKMTDDPAFEKIDYLMSNEKWDGDIVTNPPFSLATQFVNKSLDLVNEGAKVAMFLKIQFLEGKKRFVNIFKENPPKRIYVAVNRYGCTMDGVFNPDGNFGSAICYCWFIWEKGFKGDPTIKWINY